MSSIHALVPPPRSSPARSPLEQGLEQGIARLRSDDLRGAVGDLLAPARRNQPFRLRLPALGHLAHAEFLLGDWDDAFAHSDLAAALADDAGIVRTQAFLHAVAILVPSCRGDRAVARTHLARARAAAGRTGDAADRAVAAWAAAQVAWAAGEPGEVLPAVEVLAAGPGDASGDLPWRELRADALIGLGRVAEAEAVVRDLEGTAAEGGRRTMFAAARVLRGRLAARRGEDARAVGAYREGAALFAELQMPFPRAAAEAALGAQLRRRGCRREALALLTAARETFTRLGAVPFVGRVDREVVACGGSRSGDCSVLTPQESQVARLVAEGLTNRQVAEELVVSVKTVEYHLGHVFAKLGMRSRAQLAATLARSAGP